MMRRIWTSPMQSLEDQHATADHNVWAAIEPHANKPGFTRDEFSDPDAMCPWFLFLLYDIRIDIWEAAQRGDIAHDVPMRINDSARPLDAEFGANRSAHKKRPCRAVDLQCYNSYDRAVILIAAVRRGIVRVGVYAGQDRSTEVGWPGHATDSAALHIDASSHEDNPSPRVWTKF